MKTHLCIAAAFGLAGSLGLAQAGDKEALTAAIKKLEEGANYSWTSTTKRPDSGEGDGNRRRWGGGPSEGKTVKGLVYTSSSFGDRTMESLRQGEKMAFKRDGEWAAFGQRGGGNNGGEGQRRRGGTRGSRGAQLPAAEAADLVSKLADLKKDGDAYIGALTEEAAKEMLSFGGGRRGRGGDNNDGGDRPEPTGVKVTAKFWVKDGVLAKFETVREGSISFNGNERDLGRTTTVEIKAVGETKIDVPEGAKQLVSE